MLEVYEVQGLTLAIRIHDGTHRPAIELEWRRSHEEAGSVIFYGFSAQEVEIAGTKGAVLERWIAEYQKFVQGRIRILRVGLQAIHVDVGLKCLPQMPKVHGLCAAL